MSILGVSSTGIFLYLDIYINLFMQGYKHEIWDRGFVQEKKGGHGYGSTSGSVLKSTHRPLHLSVIVWRQFGSKSFNGFLDSE